MITGNLLPNHLEPRRSRPSSARAIALDIAVFGAAAAAGRSRIGRKIDDAAFASLNKSLHRLRPVFWLITQGGWFGMIPVWCGVALKLGRKRLALDIFAVAALSWVGAQGAKRLLPLDRPWERFDDVHRIGGNPSGKAFPSGHPSVAFAVARAIASEPEAPAPLRRAARSIACCVAVSRVAVGVHYPLDVIGGAALGDMTARAWCALASDVFSDGDDEGVSRESL